MNYHVSAQVSTLNLLTVLQDELFGQEIVHRKGSITVVEYIDKI